MIPRLERLATFSMSASRSLQYRKRIGLGWSDRSRARDQRALHALYERAKRPVFTLIMRILPDDRETAEEVTVDVFHDVWRRAAKFDPAGGTVVGWIMNQARSRAIDRWRFDRRKKRASPDGCPLALPKTASDSWDAPGPHEPEFGPAPTRSEAPHARGTPGDRARVLLGESTYAEAASQLKQPLGTLKTRIRSALQKLRRARCRSVSQGKHDVRTPPEPRPVESRRRRSGRSSPIESPRSRESGRNGRRESPGPNPNGMRSRRESP